MPRALTEVMVRDVVVPPGANFVTLRDPAVTGFFVRCYASSKRTFFFEYRPLGAGRAAASRTMMIGNYPTVSLKRAREIARAHAGAVASGQDPVAERRAVKRRTAVTLGELLAPDGAYERDLNRRGIVNIRVTLSALRRGLAKLMRLDVGDLTRQEIVAAITKIEDAGRAGAAADLRKHTTRFLEWSVGHGFAAANVMAGWRRPPLTRAQRLSRKEKGRALSNEEIRAVWHAAQDPAHGFGAYGALVQAAFLTGLRRGELAGLRRSRNLKSDRVVVDAEHTKMGEAHDVPLTPLLRIVIAAPPRTTSDLLFASRITGGRINGWQPLLERLREASGVQFGIHDARRSVRTRLTDLGCDTDLAEIFIGHRREKLVALYDKSKRWNERVAAAERLAEHIAAIVGAAPAANVVALPARA